MENLLENYKVTFLTGSNDLKLVQLRCIMCHVGLLSIVLENYSGYDTLGDGSKVMEYITHESRKEFF